MERGIGFNPREKEEQSEKEGGASPRKNLIRSRIRAKKRDRRPGGEEKKKGGHRKDGYRKRAPFRNTSEKGLSRKGREKSGIMERKEEGWSWTFRQGVATSSLTNKEKAMLVYHRKRGGKPSSRLIRKKKTMDGHQGSRGIVGAPILP